MGETGAQESGELAMRPKRVAMRVIFVEKVDRDLLLVIFLVLLLLRAEPAKGKAAEEVLRLAPALGLAETGELRRVAKMKAEAYCKRIACRLPIGVLIIGDDVLRRARTGSIASTSIEMGMNRKRICVLSFTVEAAQLEEALAHEACHCAMDEDVVGRWGYEGLDDAEIKAREKAVLACGMRLSTGEGRGGRVDSAPSNDEKHR